MTAPLSFPKETPFPVTDFNLHATLTSGQTFCWRQVSDHEWQGWIDQSPVTVRFENGTLFVRGENFSEAAVRDYFQLDFNLPQAFATFPEDEWLRRAIAFAPGLRLLRQDRWETVANFICSSLKQITQIQQINSSLRRAFGREVSPGLFTFPTIEELATKTEKDLRDCKLGFRARHLHRTAQQLARGVVSLEEVDHLPTDEARIYLQQLAGVGEKVANCILLFAYGRLEAFPIDVWVERALRQLYFRKKRKVDSHKLRRFAASYFGSHAGYAQQYLFHWIRHAEKSELANLHKIDG